MTRLPHATLIDLDDAILSAYGRPRWHRVAIEFAPELAPFSPREVATAIHAFARNFWSTAEPVWRLKLGEARASPSKAASPRSRQAVTPHCPTISRSCTAMTIRLLARRRKIALSHVPVAASYHHSGDGGRDSFERSIRLEGNLGDEERAQMHAANTCPVGRTLGLSADIRTNDNVGVGPAASYDDDLSELPIPNIDPD
jgi:hypothetical protein